MDRISKEREKRAKTKLARQTSLTLMKVNSKESKSASPAAGEVTHDQSRILP